MLKAPPARITSADARTSRRSPAAALGCPYASATETATTVPGNAHGIKTSSDNNRRQPSPNQRDDERAFRRNNVTMQKLHTNAAAAAIAGHFVDVRDWDGVAA